MRLPIPDVRSRSVMPAKPMLVRYLIQLVQVVVPAKRLLPIREPQHRLLRPRVERMEVLIQAHLQERQHVRMARTQLAAVPAFQLRVLLLPEPPTAVLRLAVRQR